MTVTGSQLVAEAEKLGKAAAGYQFGGTGPQYYDCSGLVQAALTAVGIKGVPRTSEEQYAWATPVSTPAIGDLVFAQFPGDGTSPGHVGIYVGGGQVYSAQDPAAGIGLASLASWKGNIVGYGAPPGVSGGGISPTPTGQPPLSSVVTQGVSGGGGGTAGPSAADLSNLLTPVKNLLHAVATVIDYAFTMFEPGQGPRFLFAVLAVAAVVGSYAVLARSGTPPHVGPL